MTKVNTPTASVFYAAANILGKDLVWHAERKSVFWVVVEEKKLQEIKWPSRKVNSRDMPHRIGLLVPYRRNRLLTALKGELAISDDEIGHLERFTDLESDLIENCPNDRKWDSSGRLWLGTMNIGAKDFAGSLYCIGKVKSLTKHLSSLY